MTKKKERTEAEYQLLLQWIREGLSLALNSDDCEDFRYVAETIVESLDKKVLQ